MNFFPGKKGHFATKKRTLPKTGGGCPPPGPPVPTPLITRLNCLQPTRDDKMAPNLDKVEVLPC